MRSHPRSAGAKDSAGKVFLGQYRAWLERQGKTHSPQVFAGWLANDYVDPTGNIHFLVHAIGGKPWLKPLGGDAGRERFNIDRQAGGRLELDGWAFDSYRRGALKDVTVFLGGRALEQAEYGLPTEWLLEECQRVLSFDESSDRKRSSLSCQREPMTRYRSTLTTRSLRLVFITTPYTQP